jgi:hypothetical protein
MRRAATLLAAVALLAVCTPARPGGDKGKGINDEGFITTWLLLAPIPLKENQSGADALAEEQVKGEAKLTPKAGDKVKAGDKELTWKEYKAREHYFDFNDLLGGQTEDSVGYAVCYVIAPKDLTGVRLRTGSDDQAKVYLNGKEVLNQPQARALEKDQDVTEVALQKGVNVLVFKVVNEKIDWSGCARFTDGDGNPLRELTVRLAPK